MKRKGQKIYCPKCEWHPRAHDRWQCSCDHVWNTFDTGGTCPACGNTWFDTQCLACNGWSPHAEWYHEQPGNELVDERVERTPHRVDTPGTQGNHLFSGQEHRPAHDRLPWPRG